jgi:hypothetical protein
LEVNPALRALLDYTLQEFLRHLRLQQPEMLAEARTQHYALAVQIMAAATPAVTSLTAAWQPVGPAQVTTQAYGASPVA